MTLLTWDPSKNVRGGSVPEQTHHAYRLGLLNERDTRRVTRTIEFLSLLEANPGISFFDALLRLRPDLNPDQEWSNHQRLARHAEARAKGKPSPKDRQGLLEMISFGRYICGSRPE